MADTKLVKVETLSNPALAEIIKNALEADGIPCFLDGESQAGFAGVLNINILVPAPEADRARSLIEEHRHHAEGSDEDEASPG